jgi:AP-2 complex subunit alpha
MVKKKAALTLLRLYRKHPDVIPVAEWALRIVSIMDDRDLVRVLAQTRRFMLNHTFVRYRESYYAYPRLSSRLRRTIQNHTPSATRRLSTG